MCAAATSPTHHTTLVLALTALVRRTLPAVKLRALVHGVGAVALSGALFTYIQFASPNIVGNDGYYHIKMAELTLQQGLPLPFPWLPFTLLDAQNYADHHMLLHVLQAPFTVVADLGVASKWAAVTLAVFVCGVFYFFLVGYQVRYPFVWLLVLFASSHPFLYRMSMARGQSLGLAFQLLAMYLILKRRPVGLGMVAVLFVWAYNAFPLLLLLVLLGLLTHYLVDGTVEYPLLLGAGIGVACGLVINPYFPHNIFFLWDHIVPKLFVVDYATSVGGEWRPYSSWGFLTLSLGAHLAYGSALFLTNREEWRRDAPRLFFFLAATVYAVLLFKSRRFVEYYPPVAVLFLAVGARDWLQTLDVRSIAWTDRKIGGLIAASLLLVAALQATVQAAWHDIHRRPSSEAYEGGAAWLAHNTPKGARVFHTDWDDFPRLFFFNTHNTYIVGLDPDFMRLKNKHLYERWQAITRGRVRLPAQVILQKFGCEYAFTDNKHRKFIAIADRDPLMKKVYSDRQTTVYRVRAEKAEPARRNTAGQRPD